MIKIDIVCPLYRADKYIDKFIDQLKEQCNVEIADVVFALTDDGTPYDRVVERITAAGYSYFVVPVSEFSHSLTREKAITEYCRQEIVVMMSQDVVFRGKYALHNLADAIKDGVVYAYGRQIVRYRSIERYIRDTNYPHNSCVVGAEDIERLQLRAFFASDAFSAYHRPTFLTLGGYDHVHMMMNEDMYYAKKVLDAGYKKAYVSTAIVEHSHRYKLKQLYRRYYDTGVWFALHPEFNGYKTTESGMGLARHVLWQALKHLNIPVLLRFLPDMASRYLGLKKGNRAGLRAVQKQTEQAQAEEKSAEEKPAEEK